MDSILLVIAAIMLVVGLIGAVLPLPGPPLSFLGLIVLNYSKYADFSDEMLWGIGFATLAITLLDYYVPLWGTKKFGGTKAGMSGSTVGLIVGMFFGPFGIFIGAFIGALLGEYLMGDKQHALKAAIGSFAGFAAGIVMKVSICFIMIFYAVKAVWGFWG
jgi:uncharacterized protein YqgC (DUF456 family)